MPPTKKDGSSAGGRFDNRNQNGNRSSFQTDSAISRNRFGNERKLQAWVPDADDTFDGSLEKPSTGGGNGGWDQFAENERLFGVKSDYDENIYTTVIDKSHPQYRERIAAAERKAREINSSTAATSHVAEERVMDFVEGGDPSAETEEDKYSGVRRQDLAGSEARENKYTPPAKRAPTGHTTVKGVPIDPAIISSQLRAPTKNDSSAPNKNGIESKTETPKSASATPTAEKADAKVNDAKATESASTTAKASGATTPNNKLPQVTETTPSATSTVERDVLKEFKTFATQQRMNAEKIRTVKAKADKEVKIHELRKFANSFKLSTPVPKDLVSIIAKDPAKQVEIQAKAMKNAEEMKTKTEPSSKEASPAPKETPAKLPKHSPGPPATDPRSQRGSASNQPASMPGSVNRHQGPRQPYPQQYQSQPYRNNRGPQHMAPPQQTGTLAQRLRNVEQQKFSQPPAGQHVLGQDRMPPTGPANTGDQRRLSGVPGHMGAKLNPNSHEFKPSPFAATFSPNGQPSASSSPRSAVNQAVDTARPLAPAGQLIRRKTKAVDSKKCNILLHLSSIMPPAGRNWDDNGGVRPPYDTFPTWRQIQDDEKADSTMQLTYKEYFERNPFSGPNLATPNPAHAAPHLAHQHQLPFHMQQGAPNMAQRQSPHMGQMRMDGAQHGHLPHMQYGQHDDHRMMQSNSQQSFASPRPGQVPVAYPGMNSPAQMPYNAPVFMGPGGPNMGQYPRSFSNNPQFMPPHQGQMGAPMMMQPQFMSGPQGMMGPQMMYPGGHPQFMPPAGPPQQVPGVNGYHSPGRPAAPMMAHQGSQQGQQMYGMSPNVQYNQPAYGPGQPNGPIPNSRGFNNAGPQQFGTSPQQGHYYGPQSRSGSSSYNNSNRSYSSQGHGQGQMQQAAQTNTAASAAQPAAEASSEAK